jgi:hypothetical protein
MQDIVLIFNIKLTFSTSIILATFKENYNEYGDFRRKNKYIHFF